MVYDVIVLGAGPAGLSAAVYCRRYELSVLVLGSGPGLMSEAPEVCNYLGFANISGAEMDRKFREHAEGLGAEIKNEEVKALKKEKWFVVETNGGTYESKALIYALGGEKRKLGIPEEKKFLGRGVSYCFTCDAPFFRNKTVAITGGSNSAAMGALLLSKFAKKVYIIYRRDRLRAFPAFVKKINETGNIETIFNSTIKEIKGEKLVTGLVMEGKEGRKDLELDGIFVEYGCVPNSGLAKNLGAETDENGSIRTGEDMSTKVKGLFAAGDVTTGSNGFMQVATASAEGAIAAASVYKFITEGD